MDDDTRVRELVRRALDHYVSKGTDQAPSTMSVPVDAYLDPDRYQAEVDAIFRKLPLALFDALGLAFGNDFIGPGVGLIED